MKQNFTRMLLAGLFIMAGLRVSAQVSYSNASTNPFPALDAAITDNQFFVGDFDNDGDADLVFWSGTLDNYYRNEGNGTFTLITDNAQTPFAGVRMPVFGQENTVMQDFDSDGDLDILYFDKVNGFHVYLQKTGTAYVQAANPFANFVSGTNPATATTNQFLPGDFDADGDIDILYSTGTTKKYYQNNGAGTFTHYDDLTNSPFTTLPASAIPVGGLQNLVTADFDADNDVDIFYFDPATGVHHYLLSTNGVYNTIASPFANVITGTNGGTATTNRFQSGDFDADGDVDFVYWTPTVNQYYENNGDGTFTFFPNFTGTPFAGINGPTYGVQFSQMTDLDNDQDIDILSNEGSVFSSLYLSGTPPVVNTFNPATAANNVPVNQNIVLTFSAPMTAGPGNIYLATTTNNTIVDTIAANSAAVTGSGTNTITIDPSDNLQTSTQYSVLFDYDAFFDAQGRAFGALDLDLRRTTDIFFTSYYSFTTSNVALPIRLLSFIGRREAGANVLNWETALEENARSMIVERSFNGTVFSKVSEVPAKGKASAYTFTEKVSTGSDWFYRLKLMDLDGTFSYSNIIRINTGLQTGYLSIYPNPVRIGSYLTVNSSAKVGTVRVIGLNGTIYLRQAWKAGDLVETNRLAVGIYVLELESNGNVEMVRFVVQ